MAPTTPNKKANKQKMSLPRQIQISGVIAFLLFLGVIFLGIAFLQQTQIQNQNYEVGTIFSDRSATQLQREVLRLRSMVANPALVDNESLSLQMDILESRINIMEDSLNKIQPTEEIYTKFQEVVDAWEMLAPTLDSWQENDISATGRDDILAQIDLIELMVNDIVRQYELLRLARGQSFTDAGKRLGIIFAVVLLLFVLFMLTIIFNTYRFVQERARAEERLAIYATELERSNQELQQFAYVASHDLQEPLRKIRTFGERLQMRNEDKLDGRSLDYIARMNNAAERMQHLIEDLLIFSRVATQTEPFVNVDLTQVAQDVALDLETRRESVNGQVVIEPLPTIEADPVQMQQLLQNLVGNGLKFHREDVPPVVKISGEGFTNNDRNQVHLYVQDNGIGIDAEHQDTIFEMFQRLHGRSDYEGTGIGLAICRRIVDRHGGKITVNSQLHQGTTFIVTLPIAQT